MSGKEESNETQETQRMYGYFGDDSDVCTINPNEKYLDYFNELSDVHTCIDMKHDQFDQKRSNAKMRNNKDYIKSIQTAIDNISAPSGEFTTDKSYYTKSSAHTLETALERNDISSFNINKKQSPDLNPLMILPYDVISNTGKIDSAGHQLEFKRFNPTKDKRVETVKVIAKDYYGESDSPAAYVLDCGPSEIYKNLNIRNEPIKSKAIFSGIMDSSSSGEYPTDGIKENYKLYVPFMRIYENKTLKGTIMMYAEPVGDGKIQVQFKYYTQDKVNYATPPDTYDSTVNIVEIPNLPEISDYLAADLHKSERVKKCIDFILKRFTKKDAIKEKCEGLKTSARDLYKAINGKKKYETDGDEFGKSFFMNIKHWGDRFRAIDAVILTKNDELAFTGTTDSFLMRFISLANLYGCYAHMGHNLIINDVKELSDEQQQSIKKKRENADLEKFKLKLNYIKEVIGKFKLEPVEQKGEQKLTKITNINDEKVSLNDAKDTMKEYLDKLFEIFSSPLPVYSPRGKTIRRAISCFVPPKFRYEQNGKEIVFEEKDMQTVWAFMYILNYLYLIARGFTEGYPSLLSIVQTNVENLSKEIIEKPEIGGFITSYEKYFGNINGDEKEKKKEIETQINDMVEECNALDDIISVSEYSQSFNLNSDHIVRNATSVVIKLKLNNKFKNYVNIIANWKNKGYTGVKKYLEKWNYNDNIIFDKYKWTPMSEITKINDDYITGGGKKTLFNSKMSLKLLAKFSNPDANGKIKYNSAEDKFGGFRLRLNNDYLSARQISNFYSGLNKEDKYVSNKIDAITYAYLSEKEIDTLLGMKGVSEEAALTEEEEQETEKETNNRQIGENIKNKYDAILNFYEDFKMNLYECFKNETIENEQVKDILVEEEEVEEKEEELNEKSEEEEQLNEKSEKESEGEKEEEESEGEKEEEEESEGEKEEEEEKPDCNEDPNGWGCNISGGNPTKSISENISELYSKMTYAEEKYASNLWSEDEDALFIDFLERKKELYEYYKKLDYAKLSEDDIEPKESDMDSFIADIDELLQKKENEEVKEDDIDIEVNEINNNNNDYDELTDPKMSSSHRPLSRSSSLRSPTPTSPTPTSSFFRPGGKKTKKSQKTTKRRKLKRKRKTRSKKKKN